MRTEDYQRGRSSLPTISGTMPFMMEAWHNRRSYGELARKGLSMMWYLMLASSIERFLSDMVQTRLHTLQMILRNSTGVFKFTVDGIEGSADIVDYYETFNQLIIDVSSENDGKSTVDIYGCFTQLYGTSVKKCIGDDLFSDIDALVEIRNLVAHSKDMYVMVSYDDFKEDIKTGSIKRSIKRICNLQIVERPQYHVSDLLYDDKVMDHFYRSAYEIQKKLLCCANEIEKQSFFVMLPDPANLYPDNETQ